MVLGFSVRQRRRRSIDPPKKAIKDRFFSVESKTARKELTFLLGSLFERVAVG